jgi:hypothetical protein
MNKFWMALFAAAISAATAHAGCEDSKAFFVNEKPLPQKADTEVELQNQESAEGGSFYFYFAKNKKPERIIRVDYGETGRRTTKLSIGASNDLMFTNTFEYYNVPITEPGSMTVREESDFYFFCDGKLVQAPDADLTTDYAKAAQATVDSVLKAPEIQSQLKAANIKPLIWK